jgi:hypothetical protein
MPTFDGGHYFLTVLAPIRSAPRDDGSGHARAPAHLIREALAKLATAGQTEASLAGGDSPFARVPGTHFARFFVLDDAVYNGRQETDSLLYTLRSALGFARPLTTAQPVDRLASKYLVFFTAFDAASGDESELDRYLSALWQEMRRELLAIFGNCQGFDRVDTAAGFCSYVKRCQVETTMPFNDYWTEPPPLKNFVFTPWIWPVAVPALVALAGLISLLLGGNHPLARWLLAGGIAATVLTAYWMVMRVGKMPFPAALGSDLRSVLKALDLQRHFIDFAIAAQELDDDALHRRFGEFLALRKPDDLDNATQRPGVIPGVAKP